MSTSMKLAGTMMMAALALGACTDNSTGPMRSSNASVQKSVAVSVKEVVLAPAATAGTVTIEPTFDEGVKWRVRAVGSDMAVTPAQGTGKGSVTVRVTSTSLPEGRTRLGELQIDVDAASVGHGAMAKSGPAAPQWYTIPDANVVIWYAGG